VHIQGQQHKLWQQRQELRQQQQQQDGEHTLAAAAAAPASLVRACGRAVGAVLRQLKLRR
jgi:hypothetical protein